MWRTIEFFEDGSPKLDVNEQGAVYSYVTKKLVDYSNNYVFVAKAFPEICGEWFEGCHVHHKDFNHFNNEAKNLICLTPQEHYIIHHSNTPSDVAKQSVKEAVLASEKKVRYYCRVSKINKKGKHKGLAPVEVAFFQNGTRFFKNTGYYANPKKFNPKKFQL